jgi:tripartite-type tricarboxylate transporter receptor subunit TctC
MSCFSPTKTTGDHVMKRFKGFQRLATGLLAAAALTLGTAAQAQNWPTKPLTIVVPFTAGSATDVMARLFGERLSERLGQPVVVENRTGAGGTIGTAAVARANPDGYTLVVVSSGHVVNPVLYPSLSYELKDLAAVAPLGTLPSVLLAAPGLGVKTVKELVDKARSTPQGMRFASAGVGSAAHVNAQKFVSGLNLNATHVPYRGTPPMLVDIAGNTVDFVFAPLISSVAMIQDNRVVPLAVSTPKRAEAFPNIPTTAEAGYPQGEFNFWIGMLAPAKTPRPVIDRLHREISAMMDAPEVVARLQSLGALPFKMAPQDFDRFIQTEAVELGGIMRAANVKAE